MEKLTKQNENSARSSRECASGDSSSATQQRTFTYVLLCTLISIGVYAFKLKEDVSAVIEYYNGGDVYYSIVSILVLALPSLLSAAYFGFKEVIHTEHQEKHCCVITGKVIQKTAWGLLLSFRQMNQYFKKLWYIAEKLLRAGRNAATPEEIKEMEKLEQENDLLEFFEDFYAGFLAVFLQLYILYREAGGQEEERFFLPKQLIASLLSISKLLIAVRRKDDGPLTRILSFLGWMAMFTGRLIVFTLTLTIVSIWPFSFLLATHVFAITAWVYSIATEKWKKANISFNSLPLAVVTFLVFGLPSLLLWPMMFQLNKERRPLIYVAVVGLENAAMLTFWFLWKTFNSDSSVFTQYRSFPTVDLYFFGLGVIGTVAGSLILLLYYRFKPKNTEKIAFHDMLEKKKRTCTTDEDVIEQYGLYYEFCQAIFPLKVKQSFSEELMRLRAGLKQEEEQRET